MKARSDKEWEAYGSKDPYFGVLSDARYTKAVLKQDALDQFFATGREHVEQVLRAIAPYRELKRERALDFGCGVGRLVIPFSSHFEQVVGMDVSEGMLLEAGKNCAGRGIKNVDLIRSDDNLGALGGLFQFIHSHIVFQHIQPKRGLALFKKLLGHLQAEGVGAFQFTYGLPPSRTKRTKSWLLKTIPGLHGVSNILKRRGFFYPLMEMNRYDLSEIFSVLQENRCGEIRAEFTDHGGYRGIFIFFRKMKASSSGTFPPEG